MSFFQERIKQLLGAELDAKIKAYVLSGAYKSLFLQAGIALLTFFTALFIARITGDKGFGIYTTVFTWISILSVGATLGLDDLVLKHLPAYQVQQAFGKIKGILLWSNLWGLLSSLFVVVVFLAIVHSNWVPSLSQYASYYTWAAWVIPLFVIMHVNQASLRGLQQIGRGQIAEKLVQPAGFFLLLLVWYLWNQYQLDDAHAIVARTGSFVLTALVAWALVIPVLKKYWSEKAAYERQQWKISSRYFALTSLLYIINTRIDIVLLDLHQIEEAEIAYYNAALKLSDMAMIPFVVLYTVAAPMFSTLYTQKKTKELQQFFTQTTFIAFVVVSLVLLGLIVLGPWVLSWFGERFRAGYPVLCMMCLIKLVHVFVGPINYLLMMVNLERIATWVLLVSVLVTIGLHLWWIPLYGIMGAATATLLGLLVFEIGLCWVAVTQAGIIPTILAGKWKSKETK